MTQDGDDETGPSQIDIHLRRAFTHLAEAALPDEIVALLDRLRAEDAARTSAEDPAE